MNSLIKEEALKYDLPSLIRLQDKRRENISIFETAIRNERSASMQEATAQANLEDKLNLYNAKLIRLSDADYKLIIQDLPKLKSTMERRSQTISMLQTAIITEQETMDRESQMISFLEAQHDGTN